MFNVDNVPLLLRPYLALNNYTTRNSLESVISQHDPNKIISATQLLKSTQQLLLSERIPEELSITPLEGLLPSRMGQTLHKAIEDSWTDPELRQRAFEALEGSDALLPLMRNIQVNPETPNSSSPALYFEKSSFRKIGDWLVIGTFDAVFDGNLYDIKMTSTLTYSQDNKAKDYSLQGSILRWLNQDLIQEDLIHIVYLFKDWTARKAQISKDVYPASPVLVKAYSLLSLKETERFITEKIRELDKFRSKKNEEMPLCSDEELWRGPVSYKYFSKAENKKATKNFESLIEANIYLSQAGKGLVKIVPGEPRACNYCKGSAICSQFQTMFNP